MIPPKPNTTDKRDGVPRDDQNPTNAKSLLLKVGEVAALLNCSTRLVWRLASEGALPRVRLGPRAVRFRRRDMEALVDYLAEG